MDASQRQRKVITQPYDYSVQDLVDKIKNRDIDLQPIYQRNYVWGANDTDENKRSRLIESLLLNIPIPVIYFAEMAETLVYEVIDGQQRLQTFQDFLNDEFSLNRLEIRSDVNGKKYSELSQNDKDKIRKRSIRAIVILNDSDEDVKYEIFERLNLGSVKLTAQEIRNNTLRGNFNDLLKELANHPTFKPLVKLRLKSDNNNMAREELVLRFFAYYHSGYKRVDQLSYFLTKYMKENKELEPSGIEDLRALFNETVYKINKYLGDKAFCNFRSKTGNWNTTSNRLLYEAEMLAFAQVREDKINVTAEAFQLGLRSILETDDDFRKAMDISGGLKIEERVNAIKKLLLAKK